MQAVRARTASKLQCTRPSLLVTLSGAVSRPRNEAARTGSRDLPLMGEALGAVAALIPLNTRRDRHGNAFHMLKCRPNIKGLMCADALFRSVRAFSDSGARVELLGHCAPFYWSWPILVPSPTLCRALRYDERLLPPCLAVSR